MIDSLLKFQAKANSSTLLDRLGLRTRIESNGEKAGTVRYGLVTMHRPGNVDRREAFREILAGLEELAAECPIVFPVHPRTRKRIEEFELKVPRSNHSAPSWRLTPSAAWNRTDRALGLPRFSLPDETRRDCCDGFRRDSGRDNVLGRPLRYGAGKHREARYGGEWNQHHCLARARKGSK